MEKCSSSSKGLSILLLFLKSSFWLQEKFSRLQQRIESCVSLMWSFPRPWARSKKPHVLYGNGCSLHMLENLFLTMMKILCFFGSNEGSFTSTNFLQNKSFTCPIPGHWKFATKPHTTSCLM